MLSAKEKMGNSAPLVPEGQQHDAGEFLRWFLGELEPGRGGFLVFWIGLRHRRRLMQAELRSLVIQDLGKPLFGLVHKISVSRWSLVITPVVGGRHCTVAVTVNGSITCSNQWDIGFVEITSNIRSKSRGYRWTSTCCWLWWLHDHCMLLARPMIVGQIHEVNSWQPDTLAQFMS